MLPEVVRHGVEAGDEEQVRIVPKESSHTTDMAMGDKNFAWPVEKDEQDYFSTAMTAKVQTW